MPVSHIGLTVSHLPTSCSFFLSALAPLGYRYFGQSGNQVGFGIDDAEFFISQETPGIKASSAHIAFLAPSRDAVDSFFIAALKAGGRIHGEPTERDPATRYYSAAVLDFDGNSIEVMHRHEKAPNTDRSDQEAHRVLSWQKEVAASIVSQPSPSTRSSPRVIVTSITKPTIMVSDQTTQAKAGSDQSSKTLIGTLLGAAAGAAVAYAMTRDNECSKQTLGNITSQAVEAARSQFTSSATSTRISQRPTTFIASHAAHSDRPSSWHQAPNRLTIAAPPTPVVQASTLIDTLTPPSEVPRYRPHAVSRSKTDGSILSSRNSRLPDHISPRSNHSRNHSSTPTKTGADPVDPRHSSVVTESRHQIHGSLPPLPASKASSVTSRLESDVRKRLLDESKDNGTVVESVAPSDSVSQAGSRRSKGSTEASRRSGGTGRHRGEEGGSQVSDKTIKAEGSKPASGRLSTTSQLTTPSNRTSVHRSLMKFLPGQ